MLRLLALATMTIALAPAADYLMYVGTYTGPESKGIYVYRFQPATGEITKIGLAGEAENPSFLAIHPNGDYLYSANETRNGSVSAFRIDHKTGKLTLLNTVSAHGAGTCAIAVDPKGKAVLVASYDSGSVALIPIKADGSIGEATATDQHKGSGVNKERQEGPHAHSTTFAPGDRYALVADLGLDKVFIYRFDAAKQTLTPNEPAFGVVAPGSGPRHVAFHPNGKFAYVVNELNSSVTTFTWDGTKGAMTAIDTKSALAPDYKGNSDGAEIWVHPNGKFLYSSNRGDANRLATFRVNETDGKLTFVENTPTEGKAPRYFGFDPTGKWLLAANQNSNNIVLFALDPETGKLKNTGKTVTIAAPVCIKFTKAK